MDEKEKLAGLYERYHALCHAMQTGVEYVRQRDESETSPKHLRVGMNSALVSNGALVKLLMAKGLITELEYMNVLVDEMEREVKSYETMLSNMMDGADITLR